MSKQIFEKMHAMLQYSNKAEIYQYNN